MFKLDHSELVFTDDALDAIAELAIKKRTGKLLSFSILYFRNLVLACYFNGTMIINLICHRSHNYC